MTITDKVKMIMVSAGVSGRGLADALGCTPQSASTKINRGIKSVDNLVKIVHYCGGHVQLVTKDGTIIPITMEDIEEKK